MSDLGSGPVAIDTAVFVYFIEADPRFVSLVDPLFREADDGSRELVTSAVTLLEVLVVPYRAGNRLLADRYEALLTRSRGIRLVDLTRDQLRAAAQLRALTSVKTPDALQLVAAISAGCQTFLTNDRRLPTVPGLQIRQLSDYAT
jgi:predicted nucleic acid-binding protein